MHLRAIPGAASRVRYVCDTDSCLKSQVCVQHGRSHPTCVCITVYDLYTRTHIFQRGTNMNAQHTQVLQLSDSNREARLHG